MSPRVYLAGPIGHMQFNAANEWRLQARAALKALGIVAYSPLRAKQFVNGGGPVTVKPDAFKVPLGTSKGIMTRDYNDCNTADALLVNFLGASCVSLGTAMELAWAYAKHIPTVVVAEPHNVNIVHPMAHEAIKFRVDTLAEGIAVIKTIVLPED